MATDSVVSQSRAWLSLRGLAVGDCFGQTFFNNRSSVWSRIEARETAGGEWRYTDDTAMAVSIYRVLVERGCIHQDRLAELFAESYRRESGRGYGGGAHDVLSDIGSGLPWRRVSHALFGGMGSFGNGGAMRSAPIGAWFALDPERAAREAALSAEVTHGHPYGQHGATAVAVAAALAAEIGSSPPQPADFITEVARLVPDGPVRERILLGKDLPVDAPSADVIATLGNGERISALDTVPHVIFRAAHHLLDYEEALWQTVTCFGDLDTNCAMVGGIVSLSAGESSLPKAWWESSETSWTDGLATG